MIWEFDRYKNNIAVQDEHGRAVSYAVLKDLGQDIADKIGERCLVFSFCENSIGSVVGYTAFVNNGIVPILLNSHMDRELSENLIANYKPLYLWMPVSQMRYFEA